MGILANKPMQKDVKAAMAAVAVTRSRLTTWTHNRYSWLVAHRSSMLSGGQTQVPPLSDTMDAGGCLENVYSVISRYLLTVHGDDVGHGKEGS